MIILNTLSDEKLVSLLKAGKIGVLPTDTIYGLACSALSHEGVEELYRRKPREYKPGTVIAASIEQLAAFGVEQTHLERVAHLWPNPISVVVPLRQEKVGPLLTTSANDPDCPPATTVAEAQAYFGDKIDFYVDGGDISGRPPSTIIRLIDDKIEVLRQGALIIINEKGQIIS